MSKSSAPSLVSVLRAFLGDAEQGAAIVGHAIGRAVVIVAAHGTRAPLDEARAMVEALPGRSTREQALRAALLSVAPDLDAIPVGKVKPAAAEAMGARIGEAFTLAVSTILTAPRVKAKTPAADIAARACKALTGLSDKDVSALLRTDAGADLCTRLQALQSVIKAVDAAQEATRKAARKAPAPMQAPVQAPAPAGEAFTAVGEAMHAALQSAAA